jgi:hypothetical protein
LFSPNEDFGRLNKALRVRFEVRFKGVSTRFWLPLMEKYFKNAHATLCSAVQNDASKNMRARPFVSTFHTTNCSLFGIKLQIIA